MDTTEEDTTMLAKDTEDEVPPLEDMTDYVEGLKSGGSHHSNPTPCANNDSSVTVDRSLLQLEEDGFCGVRPGLLVNKVGGDGQEENRREITPGKPPAKSSSGFGGLKKGFLSGGGVRKTTQHKSKAKEGVATTPDLPLLQGNKETKDNNLRLEEVQEQLRKTHPLLATKEWMTDDLLSKIDNNPVLSRAFKDPSLVRVLEQFHKNPQQALAAAQDSPEVLAFLRQFCSIMGDHFTTMADNQEKREEPLISEQLSEDQLHAQRLLEDPNVKEALLDPDIIKLMEILKTDPNQAQRFLRSIETNPRIQTKLRTLIDNGLLSVERT